MDEDKNETQNPIPEASPAQADSFVKPQGPRVVDPTTKKKSRGPAVLIMIIIFVVVAVGLYLLSGPKQDESLATPSPFANTFSPTPLPEATTEPIERDGVSISIFNGTGIAQEASFLQGKLADLGYTEIELGNASSTDNETTEVTFSDDLSEEVVDEITELLEEVYEDVEVDTSTSQDVDAEIVTGLRKGQTPAPEETATPEPDETESPSPSPSPSPTPAE